MWLRGGGRGAARGRTKSTCWQPAAKATWTTGSRCAQRGSRGSVGPEGGASAGEGACQGGSNGGAETDRGNRGGGQEVYACPHRCELFEGRPAVAVPQPFSETPTHETPDLQETQAVTQTLLLLRTGAGVPCGGVHAQGGAGARRRAARPAAVPRDAGERGGAGHGVRAHRHAARSGGAQGAAGALVRAPSSLDSLDFSINPAEY